MNTIKVPYGGKGHVVAYTLETIDLGLEALPFVNVYTVFVDDPELQPIIGEHFTLVHNINQLVMPAFNIVKTGDI